MTVGEITSQIDQLDLEDQNQVLAYLIRNKQMRDASRPARLRELIDNRDSDKWATLDELKESWKSRQ